MPELFKLIKNKELKKEQIGKDVIAGIIVAIIALPLSVALAISSGVTPEKGLITAVIAGFIISLLGGSRVQIGGPTGAFVVIVAGIIGQYGLKGLFLSTIMAGIFMIIFGILRFGAIIKFVPYPTTVGFTAGIALVLLSTQIKDFLGLGIKDVPQEFIPKWEMYIKSLTTVDISTILVGLGALIIIIAWPYINKTIPGSLIALILTTVLVWAFDIPVDTIGSRFGDIHASIRFNNPFDYDISINLLKELIRPAMTIAFLASIESLLSAVVADGMTGKKHDSNMELIAQGTANIFSSLFGGIPATGAIARTAANIKNGGRTPIAGITHAIVLFFIMVFFMPLAKLIPMTTLSAILIMVAYNMSEWRSFKKLFKSTKSDITVLLVTFLLTVIFDLVIAIEIGLVIAMFLFVRRMSESTVIRSSSLYSGYISPELIVYDIDGPLFFGAANRFIEVLNETDKNVKVIIFRMGNVLNIDATALNALKRLDERCRKSHILIFYSEIGEQPRKILTNSGFMEKTGEYRFFEDTKEAIRSANEIIEIHKLRKSKM